MANMFQVQPPMILSLPGFAITANYGLSSKDALEPLMVAICLSLYLLPSKVFIRIKKAFFHKIVSLCVNFPCSLQIFLQVRKILQQILGSGLMHWQEGFQYQQDFIILPMQDFLITRNLLWCLVLSSGVGCCRSSVCILSDVNLYYLIFCYNNSIVQKMQRSYLIFIMLRHTISSSAFLEFSSKASEFFFSPLIVSLTVRLALLLLFVFSEFYSRN
jgi:uncharacterized membrane protein (GlpM family)